MQRLLCLVLWVVRVHRARCVLLRVVRIGAWLGSYRDHHPGCILVDNQAVRVVQVVNLRNKVPVSAAQSAADRAHKACAVQSQQRMQYTKQAHPVQHQRLVDAADVIPVLSGNQLPHLAPKQSSHVVHQLPASISHPVIRSVTHKSTPLELRIGARVIAARLTAVDCHRHLCTPCLECVSQ
jgi:hypothetical protein